MSEMNVFNQVKNHILDLGYEIVTEIPEEELLVIHNEEEGIVNMMIDCEDTILIIEQHIFHIANDNLQIYKSLLQKNRELVHGAFVLDEEAQSVLYRDTLALENLDQNELLGSIQSLSLALSEYSEDFIHYSKQ